ncbi:MAG: chromosome segregation protein SMC [Thermanaeromonas sp.]|uniref:chromosome segregation protein SMC n=1 Tax=Thermanaeromonas sp. TaxID=2003697 RepID=UPI00243F05C8|nr:chromosome segregation protein SMC [Thermanaeromonas sp.]MCG0278119.1 chromosome segregation protein SMC [Thermanaeromonas sp.]
MGVEMGLFLKSLEIQGFKTFVDRTKLEFRPGITCIVGPNGSGKSNIVDAIAWVLGEQSARVLRGSRMEDVIFAGSEKRRPVGLAEVTLVLDNSDGALPLPYSEIAITRRLTRAGESEYKINRIPCRLRDIQELLLDTGAGRGGFSFIGQGRLEEILTARPEERRLLLEEAAGVSRSRWRKEQVLKRLAETEQDLIRLKDILYELENQLAPLEEEAQRARRYQKLKEALRLVELIEKDQELKALKQALKDSQERKEAVQKELTKIEQQKEKLNIILAQRAEQLQNAELDRQRLERELQIYGTDREKLRGEAKLLKERSEFVRKRLAEYKQEGSLLKKELASITNEWISCNERLARLKTEKEDLQAERQALVERIKELQAIKQRTLKALARWQEEFQQAGNSFLYLQNEWARLAEREGLEKQRLLQEKGELKELEAKVEKLKEDKENWQLELKNWEVRLEKLESERYTLKNKIATLEKRLKELASRSSSLIERRQTLLAHLQFLYRSREERQGFSEGVKAILTAAQKGELYGILGVVAEKLGVPPGLEKALEAALGASAQNILVETAEDAEAAIKYLKETKGGWATFLPLEWLSPHTPTRFSPEILREEGVLGIASDLVECGKNLRPAIEYLLGHTLVVRDVNLALRLARLLRPPARLVTLDGDLIHPRGAITGGSLHKRRGFFTQMAEIRSKEEEAAILESELRVTEEERERTVFSLEEAREELLKLEREISKGKGRLGLLVQAIRETTEEIRALEEKISYRENKLKEMSGKSFKIEEQRKQLKEELDAIKSRKDSLEEKLKLATRGVEKAEENLTSSRQRLASIEGRLEALETASKEIESQLVSLESRRENLSSRYEQTLKGQKEKEEVLAQIEEERRNVEDKLLEISTGCSKLEEALKHVTKALQDLKKEYSTLVAQRDELEQEIAALYRRAQREEVNLARLEATLKHSYQELNFRYGPNWEQLLAKPRPHLSKKVHEARRCLGAKLEELGPVDLGVLGEYKRLKDRHQELFREVSDLENGRASLQAALQEIDNFMAEQLRQTLKKVEEAFKHLFRELFGGGEAQLVITGDKDILSAGIDIVARPPGKKPQHLSLLSGGEKALTAVAFIFALLKVRPQSFCIFDEIDTALDEANVKRFARLLRSFSSKTQFVVISHRHGTMEAADVLYGVTMEEEGISRLVSVQLEQIPA